MKNILWIAVLFLAACSKNFKEQIPQQTTEIQSCDFGIQNFNLTTRPSVEAEDEFANRIRPPKFQLPGSTPVIPGNAGVLLLDFDGNYVSGTVWNAGVGDINCAAANLTSDQVNAIFNRVSNDYSPFNIVVTTDESVYNAANPYKRQRIIITETWQWYGQAGGVSNLNSFTSGQNSPGFVFSSLLNYNTKNIAEACSHEAGHTLGLRHQSVYNGSCVKTSEYNAGQGSGETGWAPIMGNSYYQNLSLWHKGPNSLNCSNIQDDVATIANVLGFKPDDFSNSMTGAFQIVTKVSATLNSSTDVDFFAVNLTSTRTISAAPFNVGFANAGENADLVMDVYNAQGTLIASVNDPLLLNASISLSAGNYFISIRSASNSFTTNYGMLGMYNVSI
ncbi:MAG: hypothetical protein C4308_06185 [Chitinophagaceae bacterium]